MAALVQGQRHERSALVLYGSETGNSEDVAEELGRMTERLHFVTRVSEMDLVEINELSRHTVVLLAISTTGQGEFPRNSRKFWKSLLRKRLPPGCLGHVSFTTFGLGDSSYPKFNWSARKLHKRLQQLGAKEIYARGEADEQHEEGIDGTFINWSIDLRSHLLSTYPLLDGLEPIPSEVFLPPKYTLAIAHPVEPLEPNRVDLSELPPGDNKDIAELATPLSPLPPQLNDLSPLPQSRDPESGADPTMSTSISKQLFPEESGHESSSVDAEQLKGPTTNEPASIDRKLPPDDKLPIPGHDEAMLIANKRITPENHWQDVRELTFNIIQEIDYMPGDTVTIYPKNFPEDVQSLIDLMDWDRVADEPLIFEIKPPYCFEAPNLISGYHQPHLYPLQNTTLRELLIHNLDITAIPKRHFFNLIANHTKDPMHKERLLEFANPVYTDEFYDYTSRPRRSILEVLQDFPSVKLPWKWVTSYFPIIRGREYSIATGGIQREHHDPTLKRFEKSGFAQLQLLVAIVKYRTVLKKVRQGLCSRYLASLQKGTCVHIKICRNKKFYEPAKNNPHFPLILIGPGTGLAPLRSLLWERESLNFFPNASPESCLTVGDHVLFFGNRNRAADFFYADEWKQNPSLKLQVYSCFSRDQKEKRYVQDLIRENGTMVNELLEKGAIVYLCGSSGKMPMAVREALIQVLEECRRLKGREEAVEVFEELERRGKFVQETW